MKKFLLVASLASILTVPTYTLTLKSDGIKDGYIEKKYGKFGTQNIKGMPSLSFPLEWGDVPKGTKSFALVMEDYDAIPVTGFSWIHWTTIIPADLKKLEENASLKNKKIVQGVNSWISQMGGLTKAEASHFGGPAPPDKTHTYTITLYALDKKLNLKKGYYLNELYDAMQGHIIEKVTITGKYDN